MLEFNVVHYHVLTKKVKQGKINGHWNEKENENAKKNLL